MLRMEFHELANSVTMRMEGRFVGDFAEHARMLIARSKVPSSLVVDLSEVSFIDATGEGVLVWFKEVGVKFVADSAYSGDVCNRLQLPLVNGSSSGTQVGRAAVHRRSHADKTRNAARAFVNGEIRLPDCLDDQEREANSEHGISK